MSDGRLTALISDRPDIPDLQSLAFRSGIDYRLLDLFDRGFATLADQHVSVLAQIIGPWSRVSLSESARDRRVTAVQTRRGSAPEDHIVMLTEASDLDVQDWLSYEPPGGMEPGSHWIPISGIDARRERGHDYIDIYADGARLISVTDSTLLRIARRAANRMVTGHGGSTPTGDLGVSPH